MVYKQISKKQRLAKKQEIIQRKQIPSEGKNTLKYAFEFHFVTNYKIILK